MARSIPTFLQTIFVEDDARTVILDPAKPLAHVYRTILESFFPHEVVAHLNADREKPKLRRR